METTPAALNWDDRRTWTDFADELLLGIRHHASEGHAQISFPGAHGLFGARIDSLEGFARSFLLAAFRLLGDNGHDPLNTAQWYAEGIGSGTNPLSAERWPRPDEHPQAKVEAASLALALDMTRTWIWDRMDAAVQDRVVDYLSSAVGDEEYWRNNWVWFRAVTQTFLRSVGAHHSVDEIRADLDTHDSFPGSNGWISDGQGRNFDHYNGWALHLYPTLWSQMTGAAELAPERLDRDRAALQLYLEDAIRLIGADGSPLIQGRSLTYRFAAAAPFWVGALAGVDTPSPGALRTAASRIVGHFVDADMASNPGLLDVGWKRPWPRLAQFYTGPGSPYWAVKGLLGVAIPGDHPVWTAPSEPLPIDTSDQLRAVQAPGWLIQGTRDDGVVRVINHGTDHAHAGSDGADSPLYTRFGYSTATSPLLDDDSWANPLDNSIVLLDTDQRSSHRTGMELLGCNVQDTPEGPVGVAHSLARAHWVHARPPVQQDSTGWPGHATTAGTLEAASVVRGAWGIRLVKVHEAASTARGIRIGGWPLSIGSPADVITDEGASCAGEILTTRITSLTAGGEPGIDHRNDATPLSDITATPFITFPIVTGQWIGALVELGSATTAGEAHFTVSDSTTDSVFNITWPDGACTPIQLSTHRKAI